MASTLRGSDNFDSLIHQGLGVNQTWQNVTGSRVQGTTYTNSTGKPIMVSIISAPTDAGRNLTIDSKIVSIFQSSGTSNIARTNNGIVQPGNSYSFNGGPFVDWYELR